MNKTMIYLILSKKIKVNSRKNHNKIMNKINRSNNNNRLNKKK